MTTKLADRQEIAEGTMAFHFEKPPGWTFEAGQAIDITLLAPSETDAEGNTRTFAIASAPDEKSLVVATRMRMVKGLHMMINESGVDEGDIRTEEFSGY